MLPLLAGAIALGVYVLTLYPGLGDGDGDSAKFAFLGRVLGTAHPPGYPAYVLVSHLFSYLPIGTLAYRINLMSACCAALAVVATYGSARALGCRASAAVAAALGLGFGQAFWAKAELAEVYALGACLVAGAVAGLLWWHRTRRIRWLLAAVACTSLAFGNHLTVVATIPALVVFALVSDWRACLRMRVVVATAAIVALGVAQYGFIVLRTHMAAPYLESRAESWRELWGVVTAQRYAGAMFQTDATTLVVVRVPELAGIIGNELGVMGTAWLIAGMFALGLRRRPELLLLAFGALGVAWLTLNVDADTQGFLLPAFVLLWPLTAVGLETTSAAAAAHWPRTGAVVVAACAVMIPVWQLWSNFALNNHSRATAKSAYYDAVFEVLPARAVIASENYATDTAVLYKLLGERAQRDRDIRQVPADPATLRALSDQGYAVFAFPGGRALLQRFGFAFDEVTLLGPSLGGYLSNLKRGWIVAVGGTPATWRSLPPEAGRLFATIGAAVPDAGPTGGAFGIVGVRGASSGALVVRGPALVEMAGPPGVAIGETGVASGAPFALTASGAGASFVLAGRQVVHVDAGIIVAVFRSDGLLIDAEAIAPSGALRVPLSAGARAVFRATFASRCESIGDGRWTDVTTANATGRVALRIDNVRPFDSRFVVYTSSPASGEPRLVSSTGTGTPGLTTDTFRTDVPRDRIALAARIGADHLDPTEAARLDGVVSRLELRVNDGGDYASITIDLGHRSGYAVAQARVDRPDPGRATFCSAPPAGSREIR